MGDVAAQALALSAKGLTFAVFGYRVEPNFKQAFAATHQD
jgi:hypothetical protein